MSLLQVRNFSKTFTIHHLERHIPVFEHLDFDIDEGMFLLVEGPNGVGKSTLLRCIFRTYLPTEGSAMYQSRLGSIDLATASDIDISLLRREELGFVTQFLRPRPRITAQELVAEPLLAKGISFDQAQKSAAELLERFGFKTELLSAYPTTFSGGEQQKVNLAHALIYPRRLLLLDEPTASLDKDARRALAERLSELKEQGVAMIGVLHHPEDVEGLVDGHLPLTLPESVRTTHSIAELESCG